MGIKFSPDDPPEARRALQTLAREQMKNRLLADVLADMAVCDIEGWDKREYIQDLQALLNGFKV